MLAGRGQLAQESVEYAVHEPPFDGAFVADLGAVAERIFGAIDLEQFMWKLERLPEVAFHTARDGAWVGFKLGYAETPTRFHSWLGGVVDTHRRRGIASRLMQAQHEWAVSRGYEAIETSALPTNFGMLALNLRHGFHVIGTYVRDGSPRVLMRKVLKNGAASTSG